MESFKRLALQTRSVCQCESVLVLREESVVTVSGPALLVQLAEGWSSLSAPARGS
jgi:hypothetical protein